MDRPRGPLITLLYHSFMHFFDKYLLGGLWVLGIQWPYWLVGLYEETIIIIVSACSLCKEMSLPFLPPHARKGESSL